MSNPTLPDMDKQKTHFADDATLAHIATLERELSASQERVRELEADANRYRWLRDNNEQHCDEELPFVSQSTQDSWGNWRDVFLSPEQLDAVIDTQLPARAALKEKS